MEQLKKTLQQNRDFEAYRELAANKERIASAKALVDASLPSVEVLLEEVRQTLQMEDEFEVEFKSLQERQNRLVEKRIAGLSLVTKEQGLGLNQSCKNPVICEGERLVFGGQSDSQPNDTNPQS